jgi:hypothetical protein
VRPVLMGNTETAGRPPPVVTQLSTLFALRAVAHQNNGAEELLHAMRRSILS